MIIKQAPSIDRRRLLQCGAAAWMSASLDKVVRGVSALAAEPNRASAVPAEAQTTFMKSNYATRTTWEFPCAYPGSSQYGSWSLMKGTHNA